MSPFVILVLAVLSVRGLPMDDLSEDRIELPPDFDLPPAPGFPGNSTQDDGEEGGEDRIIKGVKALRGQYPFMAMVTIAKTVGGPNEGVLNFCILVVVTLFAQRLEGPPTKPRMAGMGILLSKGGRAMLFQV